MHAQYDVAVIVGSLRAGSITRRVARAAIARAPVGLRCRLVEIGDVAMYNEDLERNVPAAWARFRSDIRAADAVLFLTPEYNRTEPACLKNVIDVGSRPPRENAFAGKPAGVISVTPHKLGAFGANHSLRQSLVYVNMPVMQQPEAYIGNAGELFAEDGTVQREDTDQFLTKFMGAYAKWVEQVAGFGTHHHFNDFMDERGRAAAAYVRGDAGPLDEMVPRQGQATFFPPNGGRVVGAAEVAARYDADAKLFAPDGDTRLEIVHAGASGGLAFWTGVQHADATIGGTTMTMALRVTEVFRLDDGRWKLVHRHADPAEKPGTAG